MQHTNCQRMLDASPKIKKTAWFKFKCRSDRHQINTKLNHTPCARREKKRQGATYIERECGDAAMSVAVMQCNAARREKDRQGLTAKKEGAGCCCHAAMLPCLRQCAMLGQGARTRILHVQKFDALVFFRIQRGCGE